MSSGTEAVKAMSEAMARKELSQGDVCRLTGLARATVSKILSRQRKAGLQAAKRLEKALGLDADLWLSAKTRTPQRKRSPGRPRVRS